MVWPIKEGLMMRRGKIRKQMRKREKAAKEMKSKMRRRLKTQ